ncbi:hypothetical protein AYI68_g4575 [Smittium mucronatum]|uniref:Uncharacterized protein n=1 Tax=Smittium mucronatum TaxID=133383 RepID=A0A1R0GWR0_9FUNG|nr:hypothetical protein AYI68_g4575 [Smittium mucronatum]
MFGPSSFFLIFLILNSLIISVAIFPNNESTQGIFTKKNSYPNPVSVIFSSENDSEIKYSTNMDQGYGNKSIENNGSNTIEMSFKISKRDRILEAKSNLQYNLNLTKNGVFEAANKLKGFLEMLSGNDYIFISIPECKKLGDLPRVFFSENATKYASLLRFSNELNLLKSKYMDRIKHFDFSKRVNDIENAMELTKGIYKLINDFIGVSNSDTLKCDVIIDLIESLRGSVMAYINDNIIKEFTS